MKAHYKTIFSICVDHGMAPELLNLVELLGGCEAREWYMDEFISALEEASLMENIEEEKRTMFHDLAEIMRTY